MSLSSSNLENWFNTKYYHILYQHRSHEEAQFFMSNLTQFLKLAPSARILDLACGRGRHSIFLNSLGYEVMGIDISENNILAAKKYESPTLKFVQHDMRKVFPEKFDAIFNLFTSFGYFSDEENLATLSTIKNCLREKGVGVVDYLNVHRTLKNLIREETKKLDGITFFIERFLEGGYIKKKISFQDEGKKYHFQERVKVIELGDFERMFYGEELHLKGVYGDYQLGDFKKESSERLIVIFER